MASAVPPLQPTPLQQHMQRFWLVVDFDGTCTQRDTTPWLPKLAALLIDCPEETRDDRLQLFSALEQEFYRRHKQVQRKVMETPIDSLSLEDALHQLDEVSNTVTDQVSDSGVLQGLDCDPAQLAALLQDHEQASGAVELQPYCMDVLSRVFESKTQGQKEWRVGVLSINWCPALIHAVLVGPLMEAARESSPANIPVWSNSIDKDGRVTLSVPGALAKMDRIQKCQFDNNSSRVVVYVGDSSTDLAALVKADVGILIGRSKSTAAMSDRWLVERKPLSEFTQDFVEEKNRSILWTTTSWLEIESCLAKLG